MKNNKASGFAVGAGVAIIAIVAIAGTLGWVFYNNMQKQNKTTSSSDSSKTVKQHAETFCKENEDAAASQGVFCSEEWGFRLHVPSELKNKMVAGEASLQGEDSQKIIATKAYVAKEQSQESRDNYSFEVAQYPLKAFVFPSYGHVTFDPSRKLFYNGNNAQGEQGAEAEHVLVDDVKVYVMGIGDAGYVSSASAFVKGDSLYMVRVTSSVNPGPAEGGAQAFQEKTSSILDYFGVYSSMPTTMKLEIKK